MLIHGSDSISCLRAGAVDEVFRSEPAILYKKLNNGGKIIHRLHKALAVVILSALSQAALAIPFTFEARSLGMGGVGVATADLATAAWANPAMLTNQPMESDWSLLIGIGVFARDNDDLVSDIDDFQDADERREDAIDAGDVPGAARAIVDMRKIISGIDSKIISAEASPLIAMGASFEHFAMAISVRSDVIAGGVVTDISCSLLQNIPNPGSCKPEELFSEDFNILNVEGVLATEFGVSFARDFQLWGRKVSIGIKPKIVDLQAFSFREPILTANADDILDKDENKEDLGTFESLDLGFALDLSDSVRLGLNLSNLITEDFDLGNSTLNFDTEARLGVAYYNKFLTIAADFDLIENQPWLANESFETLKTQFFAVGAEFNAFEHVKFRLGAAKNIASGISDSAGDVEYTAGIGIWLGFNLDVAVLLNDHTGGVFVQTGFQF